MAQAGAATHTPARGRGAAASPTPAWPVPMTMAGDLPRQQLAAGANGTCALLRGFEAMRQVQMRAAHEALAQHEHYARKLQAPCAPADLLALQAEMVRCDLEGATAYWQALGAAAVAMQREVFGSLLSPWPADAAEKAPA